MSTSNRDGKDLRAGRRLPGAAAVAVACALLSACGSSSSTRPASGPTNLHAKAEAAAVVAARTHGDTVTGGVIVHRPLHGTGGDEINDDNPGNADVGSNPAAGQNDPCMLVPKAAAQAILARPILPPQEAPLGPTCIYQPAGERTFVALTVETIDFAQIKPHISGRVQVEVDGRSGYCGTYGQPAIFVPLGGGKVLTVTARCGLARRFAAEALGRLRIESQART